jgi:hypothetical protein
MQIEAIYAQGTLTFSQPIVLSKQPIKVIVEVPDHLIKIHSKELKQTDFKLKQIPPAKSGSLQARFNDILGQYAKERVGSSLGEDHQRLMAAFLEKYGQ